jgi:hypothetical protein
VYTSVPVSFNIINPSCLGDAEFRVDYDVKYEYTASAIYKAIASETLVVALPKAKLIGFFGTGRIRLMKIGEAGQGTFEPQPRYRRSQKAHLFHAGQISVYELYQDIPPENTLT